MFVKNEKGKCCGCTACVNVCPKSCIEMEEDEYGFLYPQIDESKCVNCNLCRKTCAFLNSDRKSEEEGIRVYAVKNKDKHIHEKSSSGGVFIPLSDYILEKNGIVYGAGFSNEFKVLHKRATSSIQRDEFVGSKYVQSDMNNCFERVLGDLETDKYVLFSGTACQVHGLLSFLETRRCNTDKLYTIDIICHGVPSPKMWKDFLHRIGRMGKLASVSFTSKQIKSELKGLKCIFENGEEKITGFYWTTYGKLFLNNYNLRESCFRCPYASVTNRYADITLGDYWGLEKVMPDFVDEKGVSLVITHTEKGSALLKEIEHLIRTRASSIKDCLQPNLKEPSKEPKDRIRILDIYKKKGYQMAFDVCFSVNRKDKMKRIYRKIFKRIDLRDL